MFLVTATGSDKVNFEQEKTLSTHKDSAQAATSAFLKTKEGYIDVTVWVHRFLGRRLVSKWYINDYGDPDANYED